MAEISSANDALAIVANCPFPLLIVDAHGRIRGYNQALEELVGAMPAATGESRDLPKGHPARALLSCGDALSWMEDGQRRRYFEVHRVPLTGAGDAEARFFIDVTRQVELEAASDQLNRELEEHTLTDPVTGLLNSRGLLLALEPQVARSRRYNSAISVMMLDVRGCNERQAVLIAVSRLLKDQLRWADLVAVTEQQEFVLVLPETPADAALKLADKLKQQLHDLAIRIEPSRSLWPCYGVTAWRKSDSAATLLKRAATALDHARACENDGDRLIALQ